MEHILSILIFIPVFGAILGFLVDYKSIKIYGIFVAFIEFILTLLMWSFYDPNLGDLAFVEQFPILSNFNINYFVGIDGISLFLIVLSSFITLIALINLKVQDGIKNITICILLLESGLIGFFSSLDAMLFYIFWELALIPIFIIIGTYGGEKRIYACVKFFIYTFAGSIIMLVGIITMAYFYYKSFGKISFNILDWYHLSLPMKVQIWLFFSFVLAFSIKTAIFPFHTWLPYAYSQSPIVGSILISSLLAKMGTYGFIRIVLPVFPDASVYFVDLLAILACIMVIYAGLIAFAKDDMKQLAAYSSISHMGIIMLGIFAINAEGIGGAVFFMISHGVLIAAFFMIISVLYDRKQTYLMGEFSGIAKIMPKFTIIFVVIMLGLIGLPLTIGFVGEFLSLLGMFKTNPFYAFFGGLGIIIGAAYMLNLCRNVFFKKAQNSSNLILKDLSFREYISLIPIFLVVIILGVYPKPLLSVIDDSAQKVVKIMHDKSIDIDTKEFIKKSNLIKGVKFGNN
ncbi:NADH-quinone oxidoreductase subunit M [Campylobacter sputorum]|uniref:NADH-quinone oxidoreductase subunit M n=1 Tax=Campylobacter sputorum TaxID=206 RepID=UPI001E35B6CA|nr:NADH-quinone oxidoreductase subunit M [Campylobacter sputorum]